MKALAIKRGYISVNPATFDSGENLYRRCYSRKENGSLFNDSPKKSNVISVYKINLTYSSHIQHALFALANFFQFGNLTLLVYFKDSFSLLMNL